MPDFRVSLLALAGASLLHAIPASAQDDVPPPAEAQRTEPGGDHFHDEIVVTAAGLNRLDVLAGTSVIAGVELQRNLGTQIGDVLAKVPGVSATSFAPGASRPVLRGFSGERVRVLTDGIGSLDASGASSDHAVSVDPLIADKVEVLRGPAVLLYGSQAIGGAVNVVTRRIPPRVPDETVHVDASLAADTAYDRREGGLSFDVPLSGNVAFHVDGSARKTGDMHIAGFAASTPLREELLADAAEELDEGHVDEAAELVEAANIRGRLPNSWTETWSLGTGIAFFSGDSNLGLSVDYFDTAYGVPGLPGIGHVHGEDGEEGAEEAESHGEEDVSIGMKRYRGDLRGVLALGGGLFDSVQTRWSYSDYTHTEFEGTETGTVFDVEGVEGRVELVQAHHGPWRGSLGGQYSYVDFVATGEEAFVPPNTTETLALFALQEFDLGPFEAELGGRFEQTDVSAPTLADRRDFSTLSGALGLSYGLAEELRLGLNLSRAERAPSAQELFAEGPHIATQQYEIGDPAIGKEASWGGEAWLRGDIGGARLSASVYRNWFADFIYLAATGEVEDGLPVYAFAQQDMDQSGVEGEISVPVHHGRQFTLLADLSGDYVRATLADGTPVPRIPPLSLLGALELQTGHFDLRGEVQHITGQARVAPLETPTDGFTLVNLSLAWHPLEGGENVTLLLQADNLFDTDGRRHASFTKDFVPLVGRNLKLSLRASL